MGVNDTPCAFFPVFVIFLGNNLSRYYLIPKPNTVLLLRTAAIYFANTNVVQLSQSIQSKNYLAKQKITHKIIVLARRLDLKCKKIRTL
jgi:hypothetical protein